MIELLTFLVKNCSFIFEQRRFVFINSSKGTETMGNAFLDLSDGVVILRLIRDRSQIFIDLSSATQSRKNEWYSIDLFRYLLINDKNFDSLATPENVDFLKANLDKISDLFAVKNIAKSKIALKKALKFRSDKMWN